MTMRLVIPLPFDDTVERVSRVLNQVGRAVETRQVAPGRDGETIRVVASGGAGGMNPVVVTALVSKGGENSSVVRLRAAAKEGLIKQRAGEKAATRVAALLHKAR
ncbi:hypothetical protein [Streptomyces sp. DH10]|uniref:hypothetical protein n=1 Tax=Streptomyces sp. DH10 TaxID=3040121 RepID=UPI002442B3C1|nr:hypothetical protein [Streptomyces sp. DH10]MDG9710533.1 hypothetical protein [Streptomyces sp. DH10]